MAFDKDLAEGHVMTLCEAHDISLGSATRRGRAGRLRKDRIQLAINIPEIRGQVSYFVALHEIGHLVGKGRSAPRLESEANAWRYALDETLFPPTAATRRAIKARLRSYLEWAFFRQHRKHPPRFPDAEHPFWKMAGERREDWT